MNWSEFWSPPVKWGLFSPANRDNSRSLMPGKAQGFVSQYMCATGKQYLGKMLPCYYKALLKGDQKENSYCPNTIQLQETSCHYTSGKLLPPDSKLANWPEGSGHSLCCISHKV